MPDYRQHLEVETPEHVVLDYELAGLGSRALAAIIDTLILLGLLIASQVAFSAAGRGLGGFAWVALLLLQFALVWGYFTFFETFARGQTPGKRRLGIRVVHDTGHAVTFGAAAARNLLRLADFLPPPYLIGGLFVALHPRAKRLGDLVAGTVVVRDRPAEVPVAAASASPAPDGAEDLLGAPELADEEFRLLREFLERAPALPEATRTRIAAGLVARLAERFPARQGEDEIFLRRLLEEETARRRGRFGGRGVTPSRAKGRAGAERLVARKQGRWEEFRALAERAALRGLDAFSAAELPDFAARYREVAADLARARTYGADPGVVGRLERLVAAGHNALYQRDQATWPRIWRFLAVECPEAIVGAHRYILLAFATFALPALAGYAILREQPALAMDVLPDVMLERAEAGAARLREGRGYYDAPPGERPLMASGVISNNLGVAFTCFAGGVFGGVGSLVLLGFNGLMMGAASGHFANAGLLGYLWTFVIGHGVLELFAIWVAGAAGFLLGRALIAPGQLTRADALVLAGRTAVRLVAAAALFLVIAGAIEGFLSASGTPLPARLAASVGSALFLAAYLMVPWWTARSRAATSPYHR